MGKQPPKWLPGERVKETILLQRKSVEQLRADRVLRKDSLKSSRERQKAKIDAKRKRKLETKKFISAQTLLKHAQRKERQGRVFRKVGEKAAGKRRRTPPAEYAQQVAAQKVVLLVRATGKQVPPEVAAAFARLGLQKLYAARLLCVKPGTDTLVKQLEPFSIVGQPSDTQLEALLRTRGCLLREDGKTRQVISGNLIVEKALGQWGVLCIEDLVDVIVHKTDHIQDVLHRVAPFDFHPPRQLFIERHRSVHQKLEQVNTESFAAYLGEQLKATEKKDRKAAAAAAKSERVATRRKR